MDSHRQRIASFIGLPPADDAPAIEVVTRSFEDGYTRALIHYSMPDGDRIEAFVFEPGSRASMGYVLALHQHNSQWTIGKSEVAGLTGDPFQAFGPTLARRGITVLAPDAIGFESRCRVPGSGAWLAPPRMPPAGTAEGWLQYYNHMAHRLVQADLLMRKMLADCMTAVSVLQDLSGPRDVPVGAIGHSLGGSLVLFLAALDTRVAFTCSSGAVCSFRHKLAQGIGLEMSLVIPGFAKHFDIDDLIRCVAPHRLFVISSEDDPHSADATELVRVARPAFEAHNCGEHLEHFHVRGAHGLDQRRFDAIVDWTVAQFRRAG